MRLDIKDLFPWDDDVDIALKREEYDKLYQAILQDDDAIYKVILSKMMHVIHPFYRVYDARTVYDNNYIENDIELGICVDVFPLTTIKTSIKK